MKLLGGWRREVIREDDVLQTLAHPPLSPAREMPAVWWRGRRERLLGRVGGVRLLRSLEAFGVLGHAEVHRPCAAAPMAMVLDDETHRTTPSLVPRVGAMQSRLSRLDGRVIRQAVPSVL